MKAFNVASIEQAGFEADDLIATYAKDAIAKGADVTIVSSDKDLMQLIEPGVIMLDGMKSKRIGHDEVIEKFGVPPDKVVDVQSLAGDSVDNVPGVPGIGVKTAAELIKEYGDLDTLLARAGEIKQPKRREKLIEFADQARVSRELVRLKQDVPVEHALESLGLHDPDPQTLLGFLRVMEFSTLTKRIAEGLGVDASTLPSPLAGEVARSAGGGYAASAAGSTGHPPPPLRGTSPARGEGKVVRRHARSRRRHLGARRAHTGRSTAPDTRPSPRPNVSRTGSPAAATPAASRSTPRPRASTRCRPTSSASRSPSRRGKRATCRSATRRARATCSAAADCCPARSRRRDALAALKPVIEDGSLLKIGQNLKYDALLLKRYKIELASFDDTMLMSYVLDGGRGSHGMDALSERHLQHTCISFDQVIAHAPGAKKADKTFAGVPIDKATAYAAEDADVTLRLWMALKPRLVAEHMTTVYETLERPLMPVIADMECRGIKVAPDILGKLSSQFAQGIARLEEEVQAPRRRAHRRPALQPRLAQAARRIAVRHAQAARRQANENGAMGDARQPARRPRRQRGIARRCEEADQHHARMAPALQAALDLHGFTARPHPSRDQAHPYELRARGHHHRAASPRPIPTCRTSRSAPRKAGRSAPRSSPTPATS